MSIRTLDDFEVAGKRVLIRADLNVPLDRGAVADTTRIDAAARTIREVLQKQGKAIVIAHLGRPKGKRDPSFSLKPVAVPLGDALDGMEVRFAGDCIGTAAQEAVASLEPGQIVLLENLRFHRGETANDPDFADSLARLADIYVNDAFSVAHRAHASILGVAERLPCAAGRLMQRELANLERWLVDPQRPCLAILGGAKAKTKLGVATTLLEKGWDVALAGVLANTVLYAKGFQVGRSRYEEEMVDVARHVVSAAGHCDTDLVLPEDAVIAPAADAGDRAEVVSIDSVPENMMILDTGPRTLDEIGRRLKRARTVLWNGPLGAAEHERFAHATLDVARKIVDQTAMERLISVVGGGDTVALLRHENLFERFTFTSLAGGALLAWIEGGTLPGVEILSRRNGREPEDVSNRPHRSDAKTGEIK